MKVRCINEASGLVLNEIYQVIVIHTEGYELINYSGRYHPSYFETVLENEEDQFIQI